MTSIYRYHVIVKIFWRCLVSVIMLSSWSKFHVNFITGSGVKTIFFVKDLTKNQEFRNTPVCILSNIRRLRQVMDTKFGMNVSNVKLLFAAEFQVYSFYRFWVIKGKPTAGRGKMPQPPKLRLSFAKSIKFLEIVES